MKVVVDREEKESVDLNVIRETQRRRKENSSHFLTVSCVNKTNNHIIIFCTSLKKTESYKSSNYQQERKYRLC